MKGIPLELYYPIFTLLMLILTVVFVPRHKFGPLFWISLFWGFFMSVVYANFFGGLLGLFHYEKAWPFVFYKSPLWLNIAWLGTLMFYLRFLPTRKVGYVFPVYLFIFSFASMILDIVFHQVGMLVYTGWSPWYRFFTAFLWFYVAARHQWVLEEAKVKENADEPR